jgi:photosystem II stability/assembly factor-like uncharacterized protein
MPDLKNDELITRQNKRVYIQIGSARPNNPVLFAGQNSQYASINGLTIPESGSITPIWVPGKRAKTFHLAGTTIAPADLAKAELVFREKHASIPLPLTKIGCPFTFYEVSGVCGDLADFQRGWSDYVLIYSGAKVTDKDAGQRTSFDSDEALETRVSVILSEVYPIGAISFGEKAATQVNREVVDAVYANRESCGSCGEQDDGTNRAYAITAPSGAGSPGLPGQLHYTVNKGATWTAVDISGLGAAEVITAIDLIGNYLVILGSEAYFYAEIDTDTGIPGAFTKVSTGFVSGKSGNDIVVFNSNEAYIAAAGGYIYKITDVPSGATVLSAGDATTNDLYRIDGNESRNTLVAVGATGTIIKSINRGITWSTTVATPDAANTIQAVAVMDDLRYWVGTATGGKLYYTLNGGKTWVEKAFSGSGTGTVWDITFATDEVGYVSHSTTGPAARIFATFNGGADWTNSAPRINNLPTFDKAGRLVVPVTSDPSADANNIIVAGLAGNGTDGILLIGSAVKM